MELKEIISITGKPGLFKVIARTPKNFIVESIIDKKVRFSVNASQQVAILDEITVYTKTDDNIPLKTIFENIEAKKNEAKIPSSKDNPVDIREFFKLIAPEHDEERVYISDMKKILKWYEILSTVTENEPTES
jgi:hypothetical protein